MIKATFRLICGHDSSSDRLVAELMVTQVPNVGECVNVGGYPYVVHSRGWAYGEDFGTYCYLRVSPLQAGQDNAKALGVKKI